MSRLDNDTAGLMPDVRWITIDEAHAGQRLDNFLTGLLKGVPHSHIYRMIRRGEVRVDRARVAAEHRLQLGVLVRVPPVRTAAPERKIAVPAQEFPVIFEDDALLAIHKPTGVAVHGGSGVSFGVIEQLRAARPEAKLLELVHRIDKETSGLLLIAKKRVALVALQDAMRQGQIHKRYRAIGHGLWSGPARTLRFPLHKLTQPDGERIVLVREGGQYASSRVRAVSQGIHPVAGPLTLFEVDLETGRTHQIRVHLAHVGHPLVGDAKYGLFALNKTLQREVGIRRMFLHAAYLSFQHPVSGVRVQIHAPIPADFLSLMEHVHAAF